MKYPKLLCAALALTSLSAIADDDNALAALALQRANYTLEQAVEKVNNEYTLCTSY